MSAVAALEACLAHAHRAVWVYGYLGARVDDVRASDSFVSHRRDRDDLLAALTRRGTTPPAPPAGYDVPDVGDAAAARALAQEVERDCAAAAVAAVGATRAEERVLALRLLQRAATGEVAWGGAAAAFPGLPDPAPEG